MIGTFRISGQTTGETQANHWQHPELVRMTDGGIKEEGGGWGRESSSASAAFSENTRGGLESFFSFQNEDKMSLCAQTEASRGIIYIYYIVNLWACLIVF